MCVLIIKKMKKILCILLVITLYSCGLSDDSLDQRFEIIPVESAIVPEEFILGNIYRIDLTYIRPTTCHAYNNIYFIPDGNERTIAVINTVFEGNGNCEAIDTELEASFDFKALEEGSYIFKFWKGMDVEGQDIYETIEIPVIE